MSTFIFLGPELGKKQDELEKVRKKFPGAEETTFYAGETPVSIIADTVQNISLFATSRLIIVKNAEQIKKKDEINILVSCIKKTEPAAGPKPQTAGLEVPGADNTALVLLSDEIKLAAGLDDAVPGTNRRVFYELFEREKEEWLKSFFNSEGFSIDSECIQTILEMVENNTQAMKRECSRLCLFLPKDKSGLTPVRAADLEKWLSHNREESAFTLFSRIASGDLAKALESLRTMLAAKESAQSILAGLAWCFRKLQSYLALLETGETNNIELRKIGLSSPKARDDYTAAARRYNSAAAETCLALTADYDILLRSPAAALADILMDRYILAIFNTGR